MFNVYGFSEVRQTEIHTPGTLMREPSAFEFEMVFEKLERHISPGNDQIPGELIKAGVEKFALSSINLLIPFGIRRNCLRSGRSRSLYLSIGRAIKQM